MNDPHLPLRFSVPKRATLDTLEAVLAIARRGGLQLAALELDSSGADADTVFLQLRALESDLLDLFMTRLHNVIEIIDICPLQSKVARMHVA
jgi:acetolactate synthase regulatory subunit